jgi:hypothetical protein
LCSSYKHFFIRKYIKTLVIKNYITKKIILIFIFSIMPQKLNMIISNGNPDRSVQRQIINTASLGAAPSMSSPKAPSAINAPMLARVHNVRPGCGSCGRH